MSWLNKLIPHVREISQAQKESEVESKIADAEQAEAINTALTSASSVESIQQINYTNGFSVALGNAFANRGAT